MTPSIQRALPYKFRGKFVETGEWVYGHYYYDTVLKEHLITFPRSEDTQAVYIVDPETVGMWTGFYNKDNNEVYAGDIIRCFEVDEDSCLGAEDEIVGNINWVCESGGFRLEERSGRRRDLYLLFGFGPIHDIETIGNIYENPDLLSSKE